MQPKLKSALAILALLGSLCLSPGMGTAQAGFEDEQLPQHYVVKADRIFAPQAADADRDGWVHGRWLEVEAGRVKRLGQGTPPAGLKIHDLGSAWLMPGLVDMGTEAFRGNDPDGIGPRYVAADKFNPFADFKNYWSRGITSARLGAPGRRFISGQGSVVKFGGEAETAVVLVRSVDLELNFNDEAGRNEADIEKIPFPSSSDVPYETEPQPKPQTRLGRIDALRTALASLDQDDLSDPRSLALRKFLASGRPLRLDARRAADINQAIAALEALKSRGLKAYLAGADEALALTGTIAASGVPVVFEIDNQASKLNDNEWNEVRPWRRDPGAAAALDAMGVPVILGGAGADLLMAAAIAVGSGMNEKAALEAITIRPARLMGLENRIGALEAGRDADFIVLNGNPLSSLSHVQEVFVAGKPAWRRDREDQPLVIRAGRLLDGLGGLIRDGEILVEGGKIVAIGQRVPHPKNARFIDAGSDAVVTPGFIDSHSFLGMENDRNAPGADLPLADVFAASGPEFEAVAQAGVTTALVTANRVSAAGGQVVAIKTSAKNQKELIAKPVAAVKLMAGGSTDQVRSTLTALLSRAKKYHETWLKYEEELAKFSSGAPVTTTPEPAAADSKPAEEAKKPAADDQKKDDEEDAGDALSGTWAVTLSGGPMPKPQSGLVMKIRLEGERVVGTMTNPLDTDEEATFQGTFDGKALRAEIDVETPFGSTTLVATLSKPEVLDGTISLGGVMDITLQAQRTKKGAPKIRVPIIAKAIGDAAPAGPKKPNVDDNLEPLRAVFKGQAGLMVQVKGAPLLRTVSEVCESFQLPVVLLEAQGILDVLDELKGETGVALAHDFNVTQDGKQEFIPGHLERKQVPMAFQSSAGHGAQGLPHLARMAVREGLGAETALKALTGDAARMLRLDDTVGSLKAGLDGDLLIFDGDPLDVRTRLKSVFIRGQEVK